MAMVLFKFEISCELSIMCRILTRSLLWVFALVAGAALPVYGHSAEQGFILLLPTGIYITAGTLTVVASILLVSVLGDRIPAWIAYTKSVPAWTSRNIPAVSLISTGVLFGLIWVGTFGPRDPLGNPLPLTIWTLWWIGLVAVLPILGNVWNALNPWTGLYSLVVGAQRSPLILPVWLGIWPGVLVFLAFHIFAIADIAPSDPNRLSAVVAGYWGFTFIGMVLFGAKDWLQRAECFTIFFRFIASLAPMQNQRLGVPGWALLRFQNIGLSHMAFCIVMLGAGSFDGLHETFWWLAQIGINPLEFPGRSAVIWTSTFGMIGTCLALGLAFTTCVWIGHAFARAPDVPFIKTLPLFALSLIPIAYGYHIAHYLTSFLVSIQYSAIAISDPLANGSNYVGMSKWQVTTGFLNDPAIVKVIWLTQASAVVLSHVVAVMLAHAAAAKLYQSKRQILLSQSALSVLMIAYTVFGLWLLASPRGV